LAKEGPQPFLPLRLEEEPQPQLRHVGGQKQHQDGGEAAIDAEPEPLVEVDGDEEAHRHQEGGRHGARLLPGEEEDHQEAGEHHLDQFPPLHEGGARLDGLVEDPRDDVGVDLHPR